MRYKLLGKSGLRVSELCLGTMTFMKGLSWGAGKEECRKIFGAFLEGGGNFIDTSNSYGTSEEYLSEFMGGDRDRIVVGTKYTGSTPTDDVNRAGNHRKSLIQSVEGSLRRLKCDYIDLLWLNAWDSMTPIEEIMRALDDLVRQGKVLYLGASNAPAWFVARANTIAESNGWTPFVALQLWYNLLERDIERELLPMAHTLDLTILAWTPLASGLLTGKYGLDPTTVGSAASRRLDDSKAVGFVQKSARNLAIVEEVRRIAREIGRTPAQVALNWLRARGAIPIVGARSAKQLSENLNCVDFDLFDDQFSHLDRITRVKLGFPHDFLTTEMVRQHMFGGMFQSIDNHRA